MSDEETVSDVTDGYIPDVILGEDSDQERISDIEGSSAYLNPVDVSDQFVPNDVKKIIDPVIELVEEFSRELMKCTNNMG